MGEGLLHPSIIMKIQGQPYQFTRNSYKPEASTSVEKDSAIAYMKGSFYSLHNLACQDSSASSAATPMSPVLVEATSKKSRNQDLMKFLEITAIVTYVRPKLLMQCQNELIKAGRISYPYKGLGDCLARTRRNEGDDYLLRGTIASFVAYMTIRITRVYTESHLEKILNHTKVKEDHLKKFPWEVAKMSIVVGSANYLCYPLRYAATRLATDTMDKTARKGSRMQFIDAIDVFRKTIKTDGIVGIYRGCNVAFIESFLFQALSVGIRVGIVPQVVGLLHLQPTSAPAFAVTAFGSIICPLLVTFPLDTLSRRMMIRSTEAVKYTSSLDAFSKILKTEGFKSLYKGASMAAFLNSVSIGSCLFLLRW